MTIKKLFKADNLKLFYIFLNYKPAVAITYQTLEQLSKLLKGSLFQNSTFGRQQFTSVQYHCELQAQHLGPPLKKRAL